MVDMCFDCSHLTDSLNYLYGYRNVSLSRYIDAVADGYVYIYVYAYVFV